MLTFRAAAEADLDRLIEIHTSSYPDPRGHAERHKNFTANPRGDLASLCVVEDDGAIVAHGFLFALRGYFAGGVVNVGGIASLAVAPEARGRGVAAALLAHLHAQADAAKAAVTILYAFRQGFYARHGYAPATPNHRLAFHPAAVPFRVRPEDAVQLRAVKPGGGDRAAIQGAYLRAAARAHGWLARPVPLWDRCFADERRVWILATQGKRVTGYVAWTLAQTESHAATRLHVCELVADDDATKRALLAAVGAQRDQVSEVLLDVDARDPIDRALLDADRARSGTADVEHALGAVTAGPMVRLVDVARALSVRTYAADGALDLVVDGRPPLHVGVAGGRAKLSVPRAARAPLAIDRAALAAVLFGGLSPTDAARLGWATADPATLARADAIFASPPFFALDSY